jgi:hypothetical protein
MEKAPTVGVLAKRKGRNRRPDHFKKRVTAIKICGAWLNMTTPLEMRDLAERLLTYEAKVGKLSEPVESITLRVYEKLRLSLGHFAGTAAFQSLASRALAMARLEISSLRSAQVSADGTLEGLGRGLGRGQSEFGPQIDFEDEGAGEHRAGDEGIVVIARLLGLLRIFLGEALTLSLLRNAWPREALDDCNSAQGRKE